MKNLIRNLVIVCLLVIATIIVIPNVLAEFGAADNTLTVNGLDNNVNVNWYRIMTVNIENNQPKDPVYSWVPSVATWLKNNGYGDFVVENSNVVNHGENGFNSSTNSTTLAKMYGELAAAIRTSIANGTFDTTFEGVTRSTTPANSGDGSSVTFTDLELGNYFILADSSTEHVYAPTSVRIVPVWNTTTKAWDVVDKTVNMKSTPVDVTKTASTASASIGGTVTYTLSIDVPTYPDGTTNKTLELGDVLSDGLTFVDGSMTVMSGTNTLTSQQYNVTSTPNTNGGGTLTINFGGTYYDAIKAAGYTNIVVTYKAIINENAVVKEAVKDENGDVVTDEDGDIVYNVNTDNTATLKFNHDPYGNQTQETGSTVTVYTYGLDVTKIDATSKEKLSGAQFKISTDAAGNTVLHFTKVSDGVYRYDPAGTVTTDLTVASDGTLRVTGLDLDTYYITETKAPNEYIIKSGALPVTIADDNNDGIANKSTTGYFATDFENSKSLIDLPVTGGIGTLIFSIIGILFMGISIVLIKNILKKKEVQL